MMKAVIDYSSGRCRTVQMWGEFNRKNVESFFTHHANQCSDIRKNIMCFNLLSLEKSKLPEPWCDLLNAVTVLKYNDHIVVWNAVGEKIKSEWD